MTIKTIQVADSETLAGKTGNILRKSCSFVSQIDHDVVSVIEDLRDTLRSDTLSVGLAAPQIGYDLAVAVVNLDKKNPDGDLVLINPVVKSETGQWDEKYESCMSIPHKRGQVKRRKKIAVSYLDQHGNEKEIVATGFEARVILHEIDHLNGVLFVDRMDDGAKLEDTDLFRDHGIT